jgi:predicted transcriptional regulator
MSKAVLISIKPKWCDLIRQGRKTVEVRKTCPKLEVPFKVYIYETMDGKVVGAALFSASSSATALMCSGRSARASASSVSRRCTKAA